MKTFHSYSEVSACVGQEVAVTDWITITQEQVNLFAQATGDHQWIHVDPERAKAGPFGAPIAHGFLTLSLIPRFFEEALTIEGARMGVNYGLNRVRFTSPEPVRSRMQARISGPFGAPIAHGFLTLSLLPKFFENAMEIREAGMGVNYGLNKVRFTSPVPVGSRVRARLTLQSTEALPPDGMQMNWLVTVEREGGDKPACVAESLSRSYGAPA